MSTPSTDEITQWLVNWSKRDAAALEKLTPLVHQELHRLAQFYMRGERAGHMLQTTALVNEAYLRLIDVQRIGWQNRAHFFGVAANLMRHILVDFARTRDQVKRGGGLQQVSLDEALTITAEEGCAALAEHLLRAGSRLRQRYRERTTSGLSHLI